VELTFDIFSGIGAGHRDVAAGLAVSMLRGSIDPSESYLLFRFFCDHQYERADTGHLSCPMRGSRDRRVRTSAS
jgi:hypothetical protein